MKTLEEQLTYWKNRCAHAEKELKAANIALEGEITKTLKAQADSNMWRQKALAVEQSLRERQ